MSRENHTYLKNRYDFFECFTGIVVSGYEQMIKPEPSIYRVLCERYHLEPEATLFLDDTLANVVAARRFGLQALQVDHNTDRRKQLAAVLTSLCGG